MKFKFSYPVVFRIIPSATGGNEGVYHFCFPDFCTNHEFVSAETNDYEEAKRVAEYALRSLIDLYYASGKTFPKVTFIVDHLGDQSVCAAYQFDIERNLNPLRVFSSSIRGVFNGRRAICRVK